MVKKKIPTKHRSFDNVLEEVEMFFRVRRKILAPGILRDVLVRIGLPTAKKIVTAQDLETAPAEVKPKAPTPKPEPEVPTPVKEEPMKTPSEPISAEDTAATFVENPELDVPGVTVLDGEDFTNITDALNAVESMSDTFMAARPKKDNESVDEEKEETTKTGLRINIAGSEEITAAPTTFASTPTTPEELDAQATELEPIEVPEPVTEAVPPEVEVPIPEPVEVIEEVEEPPAEAEIEEELETPPEPEAVHEEPVVKTTPAHVVKPLVPSKILILGEAGVGKQSLMRKAELEPVDEDTPGGDPYIHTKLLETENHRVRVHVWSFDEAVKSKISRKEFYDDAEALIVVYAASDRWSFESIDFWLKEATITTDEVPPIVIVANKTDLVKDIEEDAGEHPVTPEEGFALAEELANKYGNEEKLHPVAFIGTSCLTGEGVLDVFTTAAELAALYKPEE
jgi:GTPase SAR1 family protein